MEREVERRVVLCERADDAEWEETVALAGTLEANLKAYLKDHPPGLVKALWRHFDATRDRCGCTTPEHERAGCSVRLIEKLLLDEEVL